jgi:hypothetical protein
MPRTDKNKVVCTGWDLSSDSFIVQSMTFSLRWLSEERQKNIFALIEKLQVAQRGIYLFRLHCEAPTVLVWIEYRIELCWGILFEMWGWNNDVDDVNGLRMELLPSLCW